MSAHAMPIPLDVRPSWMTRAAVATLATAATAFALPASAHALALSVTTDNPQDVTSTQATLRATVSVSALGGNVVWQYGTTTRYGTTSAAVATGLLGVNQTLTLTVAGLAPDTTYHVRAVATSGLATAYGRDVSFTTARVTTPELGRRLRRARAPRARVLGLRLLGLGLVGLRLVGLGLREPDLDVDHDHDDHDDDLQVTVLVLLGQDPRRLRRRHRHRSFRRRRRHRRARRRHRHRHPVARQDARRRRRPRHRHRDEPVRRAAGPRRRQDRADRHGHRRARRHRRAQDRAGRQGRHADRLLLGLRVRGPPDRDRPRHGAAHPPRRGLLTAARPPTRPTARAAAAKRKASKKKPARSLWGSDDHGRFQTRGRGSVATVRGTRWLTQDTCAGTLTRVVAGAVAVRDLRGGRTTVVTRGHQHLARMAP